MCLHINSLFVLQTTFISLLSNLEKQLQACLSSPRFHVHSCLLMMSSLPWEFKALPDLAPAAALGFILYPNLLSSLHVKCCGRYQRYSPNGTKGHGESKVHWEHMIRSFSLM